MPASKKAQTVRSEIAKDILDFIKILENKLSISSDSIGIADSLRDFSRVPQVENMHGSFIANNDFWEYDTSFRMEIVTNPSHMKPNELYGLILEFKIKIIADSDKFEDNQTDPLEFLEFNIIVSGTNVRGEKVINSLHLDRHPDYGHSPEAHPKYHFQFGGRNLHDGINNYGNAMFLDTPRIMHYPMDFILGVDFVLSNYFSDKWIQLRENEHDYNSLVGKYQKIILKPYFKAMSSHWDSRTPFEDRNWNTQHICPQIVEVPKNIGI